MEVVRWVLKAKDEYLLCAVLSETGEWRIRTNQELHSMYGIPNLSAKIRSQRKGDSQDDREELVGRRTGRSA